MARFVSFSSTGLALAALTAVSMSAGPANAVVYCKRSECRRAALRVRLHP